jgi:hypothetical protein
MATARPHKPKEKAKLETFGAESGEPCAPPFAGLGAAVPWGKPADEPALALEQMRLAIEDNLLMVFGPDGDPVPPQMFTAAAAAYPATLLELPDGTTAAASRIAAVLHAQVLGRLGRRPHSAGWILAMLREGGGPEPASEAELRAEQDASEAIVAVESRPSVESDDHATSCTGEHTAAAETDATPATPQDENAAAREVPGLASLEQAATAIAPSRDAAMLRFELDPEKPASGDMPNARSAQADAKKDAKADAERTAVRPGRPGPVATRRLPEGGRRSNGARDDDGGWFSSLRNLSTLTIARGAGSGSSKGAGAPGVRGDLRTRTVPLAGDGPRGARRRDKGERGPLRTVALGLTPQALEAEGFHALVVRDVPAAARLSAGAYDPALDGWVMRPRDLSSLTISAPPELHGDFTVTLMGIALRPGDANAVRILAWLPVRIDWADRGPGAVCATGTTDP